MIIQEMRAMHCIIIQEMRATLFVAVFYMLNVGNKSNICVVLFCFKKISNRTSLMILVIWQSFNQQVGYKRKIPL